MLVPFFFRRPSLARPIARAEGRATSLALRRNRLTVGLGHTLDLVLLLDGVRVGGSLGGVDELVGKALREGLDVPEGGLTSAGGEQPDGLVDAPEGEASTACLLTTPADPILVASSWVRC